MTDNLGAASNPALVTITINPALTRMNQNKREEIKDLERKEGKIIAYPNPSPDGRYKLQFTEAILGEVSYKLTTSAGAEIAKGKQFLKSPTYIIGFDFSTETKLAGLYYLQVTYRKEVFAFKLLRSNHNPEY
ncbi:T9SS type A sorting domain-containing protein [Flavisolibacter sp. BT320]|nr:T9SS type A sorting domain-containing protein [Flavisolibacter longurius]